MRKWISVFLVFFSFMFVPSFPEEPPPQDIRQTLETIISVQSDILQKLEARLDQFESGILQKFEEQRQAIESLHQCCTEKGQQIQNFQEMFRTDECKTGNHTCSRYAECVDLTVDYKCQCMPGYSGDGWTCTDINECDNGGDTVRCPEDKTCINLPGNYTCQCSDGFTTEEDGSTCTDIDECSENPKICGDHGSCNNHHGGYKCYCNKGYDFIDNTCKDIDECSGEHGCLTESLCVNTVGSYTCQCQSNFTSDGKHCEDRTCEKPFSYVEDIGCIHVLTIKRNWYDAHTKCLTLSSLLLKGDSKRFFRKVSQVIFKDIPEGTRGEARDYMWIGADHGSWVGSSGRIPKKLILNRHPDNHSNGCGTAKREAPYGVHIFECSDHRLFAICQRF